MKTRSFSVLMSILFMLTGFSIPAFSSTSGALQPTSTLPQDERSCTSFCLDNGDHCVFGTNMDNNMVKDSQVFVNKRGMLKTGWEPGTTGKYARWIAKYGSVTINVAGYQFAWGGMNEAGLMISTMALNGTVQPDPDERPAIAEQLWNQYQLDNFSTVEEVIASDSLIRITYTRDHHLVCDRTGACAVIESLNGKTVVHTGNTLPVKALANRTYQDSLTALRDANNRKLDNNSLVRFVTAAEQVEAFEPSNSENAVAYTFDTLKAVSQDGTAFSAVFDPVQLRVYFRSYLNPQIRYLDFEELDFSCGAPVMMLGIQAAGNGDMSSSLVKYSHKAALDQMLSVIPQAMDLSPIEIQTILTGFENTACMEDNSLAMSNPDAYLRDHPLRLLPLVTWAGLMVFDRLWWLWLILVLISLAFTIWRLTRGQITNWRMGLVWILITIIAGPFGLLALLLTQRRQGVPK